jgi:hypothetical protein
MDTFGASELSKLTGNREGTCVTIFMPTHATGRDGQQDALRLKNLVAKAERVLIDRGTRSSEARKLLQPVRDLPGEPGFWEKRSHGLALFVADNVFDRYRVPISLHEEVVVNQRFQVKPLLPLLGANDEFFLLAFSQNRVRFFRGRQFSLQEIPVKGMPENMQKALNYDQVYRGSQVHSAQRGSDLGKQGAVFHGQGGERELAKDDLARYFRIIDSALHNVLRSRKTPLILAAVQYLLPIYRDVTAYPYIAREELAGNPDHLSDQELHAQAWPFVKAWTEAGRADAAAKYRQLAGTGKTADDLKQILTAACQGQVECLFVDRHAHQWGSFNAQTNALQLNGEPDRSGLDDLLDLAAAQTLTHSGTVYSVECSECPSPPICAVLRY